MTELEKLGMTDHASRRRGAFPFKTCVAALLLLALYIAARNYVHIAAGMLTPDFDRIHAAYDFNLIELPWTLALVALACLLLGLARPLFRRRAAVLAGLFLFIAADLCLLRYYVTQVEPERLILRHVRLETPKLQTPIRILHLSDIQAGAIGDYHEEMFRRIDALDPDLILFTGDFLQPVPPASFHTEWPKLHALFAQTKPPLGVFAVFGDTERELYGIPVEETRPVRTLSSRSANIAAGGGMLSLHGLSLYQSKRPEWAIRSIDAWLEDSDPAAFRILLGHAPDFALALRDLPVDLCLAGHTHGGQVRLPFFGPLVIDSAVPEEWSRGFRRIGVPYLNVSAGAGSNRYNGLPQIRFNCPTEMTLLDLVPLRAIR